MLILSYKRQVACQNVKNMLFYEIFNTLPHIYLFVRKRLALYFLQGFGNFIER